MASPDPVLSVAGLSAGYDGRPVVFDIDIAVLPGEVVTLLGSNGAGKTTVLNSIVGLVRRISGDVVLDGATWDGAHPHRAFRRGMGLVPAERFVFPGLSVSDSLRLGARNLGQGERADRIEHVLDLFPKLGHRLTQRADTMSGGEQRMLSMAVALLGRPQVLLLDEPSLGLAPAVATQVADTLRRLATEEGLAVVLVEQNVRQALRIADRAYIIRSGRIIHDARAAVLREQTEWWSLF